ncbi:MAG TPA: molecular chaperone TorD family protein [Terriglobales bacterium]|jgi:DMSO reductase family type II enzyme chaperone|nr:molecular chaperone TorD family protein [Terriglobales bacterium]
MNAIPTEDHTVGPIDWHQTDLYRFFARVLSPPTRECFNLLSQPEVASALHRLWISLDCKDQFPGFAWFASYELYESAYIALFDVGVPEPPVPLFESAHDKRRPAQEIAVENTYFYDVLGLRSDPGKAVPDYLVTQLEFLAALRYTGEQTGEEATAVSMLRAESDFIERHLLNWIPMATSKLGKTGAPGFPVLMQLLAAFLSRRHDG